MAQLVARLNGIQKARGSNPLVSTKKISYILYDIFFMQRQGYLTNAIGRLLIRFLL